MIDKELPTILDQNMMVEDVEPHSLTAIVKSKGMGRRNQGNISLFTRHGRQNQGNNPCSIKTWFVLEINCYYCHIILAYRRYSYAMAALKWITYH